MKVPILLASFALALAHGLSGQVINIDFDESSVNSSPYAQGDDLTFDFSPGQNPLFTIGGVSKQTSWDGVVGGIGVLTEGVEHVGYRDVADAPGEMAFTYANVVSDPGGNVATDLDGVNSRFAAISGIQFVAVPEPAAVLAGALGFLLLLRRHRA